jgi:hypothetical protein
MRIALVLWLAVASSAAAQDASEGDVQRIAFAQQHFERGMELYDARDFEGALASFESSFELVPSPNSRLYVARTLRELGRTVDAVVVYEEVVRLARVRGASEERFRETERAASTELELLARDVGHVVVRLDRAPAGTAIAIDDREVPLAAAGLPWPVAPGSVQVVARAPDGRESVEVVAVERGGTAGVRLSFEIATPREVSPIVRPAPSIPDDGHTSRWSIASIVAASIGVVGFASFAGFGLATSSIHDDLETMCGAAPCPPALQGDVDRGEAFQIAANIGLGAGIAGAATAILFMVLALGDDGPERAAEAERGARF